MNFKISVFILLTAFMQSNILGQPDTYFLSTKVVGQPETYSVKKASFSSDKYDEFSPVGYKKSIVFCSNRPVTKLLNYSTEENKGFIKINSIDTAGQGTFQNMRLFSKTLNTKLNDGPVTFNSKGDTIYFSRNLISDGKYSELSNVRNKLGIFYAVFDGHDWTKVRELRFNSEWYNVTTPCISPDGKRLFFASDKPGGYGGSDLYYSVWKDDYWDEPVNLGPVINSKGNESYPYMNAAGEFFFSSDGHSGLGGKDIFFSRLLSDSIWIEPVCLDAPVNSPYDDFGIFTDTLMNEGYFSSNRDKSIDIFHFSTNYPQVFYNISQKENNYCFEFNDSGSIVVDTLNLQYRWTFGDGKSKTGDVVSHCFPGPGTYNISLDIIERTSGRLFFTKLIYKLKILDFEQAYIDSPDYAIKTDEVSFDARKSYLPGYKIIRYYWDFGDKSRSQGETVKHTFSKKGEYSVNLEVALRSDATGLMKKTGITKKIMILDDAQDRSAFINEQSTASMKLNDVKNSLNAVIIDKYSAESESRNDVVYRIELLRSKSKLDIGGSQFRNVPQAYKVKERYNPQDSVYSYTVEQELNLMATYPSYMNMVSLGFKNAKIKMDVLTEKAERELNNLIRINGAFADTYFDKSDRLTSNAFIMLDQIVKLMNKFPKLKLEIAVHNDNSGPADVNQALTQKRAQLLVDYLVTRGVSVRRLIPLGFGASKPIAGNYLEKDRKLNRRIDFTIIDN